MVTDDAEWDAAAFDAVALTVALRISPLSEREIVERWLAARAARREDASLKLSKAV